MDKDEIEEFIKSHGGTSAEDVCVKCAGDLREYLNRQKIRFVEVEDVIQDVMLILVLRIRRGTLILKCSFTHFLFRCCRRRIYEICRWKDRINEADSVFHMTFNQEENPDKLEEEEERIILRKRAQSTMHMLGERFNEMIELTSKGVTGERLRSKLGFKNAQAERDYRKNCKIKVRNFTNNFKDSQGFCDEILGLDT